MLDQKSKERERRLYVIVERPDGTLFGQAIEWKPGVERIRDAVDRYRETLGKDYWICNYWVE